VCKSFKFGFPDIWQRLVNPKMVPDNEHARSPSETTTGAPSPSVEAYMAYFLSDSFSSSITYDYDLTEYRAKIRSVVNERYRSTVGCGQAEEDADIQQENMHSCSSEHGMVTLPIDCTSSQFGATDALELPTEGMTPKFGAIGGSEASTCKRLRSRKAHGMPSGGPMKRGHKQKKIQHNQGATSTADLTPLENVGSEDSTCKRLRSGKVHGMPSGGPMKRGHKQKKIQQMVNQGATSTADLTSHVH
jgi:Tfp pilus assembly protein FimV